MLYADQILKVEQGVYQVDILLRPGEGRKYPRGDSYAATINLKWKALINYSQWI